MSLCCHSVRGAGTWETLRDETVLLVHGSPHPQTSSPGLRTPWPIGTVLGQGILVLLCPSSLWGWRVGQSVPCPEGCHTSPLP